MHVACLKKFIALFSGVFRNTERGPQGSAGRSPLIGSRGKAPAGGLRTSSPRSWSILKEINCNFYAKNLSKMLHFLKILQQAFLFNNIMNLLL
jgi:hypothetical protein